MRAVQRAAGGFVAVFAAGHLLDSALRPEVCDEGYFVTLTVWTLAFTAYAAVVPCCPPALVAAALGTNVLVCALYYAVVNQGVVNGASFLLHGGCSLVLAWLVSSGAVSSSGSPAAAGLLAGVFLTLNALAQLWHERRSKKQLYPTCGKFGHPAWRALLLPLLGAGLAAVVAHANSEARF